MYKSNLSRRQHGQTNSHEHKCIQASGQLIAEVDKLFTLLRISTGTCRKKKYSRKMSKYWINSITQKSKSHLKYFQVDKVKRKKMKPYICGGFGRNEKKNCDRILWPGLFLSSRQVWEKAWRKKRSVILWILPWITAGCLSVTYRCGGCHLCFPFSILLLLSALSCLISALHFLACFLSWNDLSLPRWDSSQSHYLHAALVEAPVLYFCFIASFYFASSAFFSVYCPS